MLRFQLVLVSSDPALKRQVRRLTLALGAAVEAVPHLAALPAAFPADRPVHLLVIDARHGESIDLAAAPAGSRILCLLPDVPVITYAPLLADERVTSLLAADEPTDEELIASATKAIRGEVFGLAKYMPWGVTTFALTLHGYDEKSQALAVLLEYATVAGCRGAVRDRLSRAADEMLMNALYHGSGATAEGGRTPRELAQEDRVGSVHVQYGCSGRWFGLAVRDQGGGLERSRIVEYLSKTPGDLPLESKQSGAGLGMVSIAQAATRLIYNLEPGRSCEVIALFDIEPPHRGKAGARSLHVFMATPRTTDAVPLVQMPPTRGSSGTVVWSIASVLLAVASALGTLYVKQRIAARSMPAIAAAHGSTLTVFPEPSDALVKLNGVVIGAGTPVAIDTSGVRAILSVERAGYRTRTLEVEPGSSERIYVTLTPRRERPDQSEPPPAAGRRGVP